MADRLIDLESELTRRLQATTAAFARELRDELRAWHDARLALDQLADNRLLPLSGTVEALHAELAQADESARRFLHSLERYSPSEATAETYALGPIPLPPPTAIERAHERPVPKSAAVAARARSVPYPAAAETLIASSRTELAIEIPVQAPTEPEVNETPDEAAPPVPAPQRSDETPPKAPANVLKVVCPHCDVDGTVPWDRLNRLLKCKGCSRCYRVSTDGQLTEMQRGANGRWVSAASLQRSQWRAALRRPPLVLTAALALLCALGLFVRPFLGEAPAATTELPSDLEPRAELLAKAWLQRDLPLMRRLAHTRYERGVYSWLLRHPPPLRRPVEEEELNDAKFEIQLRRKVGNRADVVVRVAGLPAARSAKGIDYPQQWEEREGIWFYIPSR
jgi:hypothetical protein